jgi:hypothetical protein
VCKWFICVAMIFGDLWNVTLVKSLNQHLGTNLLNYFFIVIFKKINNTSVYNFNVCCQGETRRPLVVQPHLCIERKRGDNSTTNRVLKIYWPCIEYTRFPRDHFKPMIFLEVCKKKDIENYRSVWRHSIFITYVSLSFVLITRIQKKYSDYDNVSTVTSFIEINVYFTWWKAGFAFTWKSQYVLMTF